MDLKLCLNHMLVLVNLEANLKPVNINLGIGDAEAVDVVVTVKVVPDVIISAEMMIKEICSLRKLKQVSATDVE